MAGVPPLKNSGFTFYIALVSQADTDIFQVNPTLAAGDFQVSIDGGAFASLAALPTVSPAAGRQVEVVLSADEMNGDAITVQAVDAAGDEWQDLLVTIHTETRQINDLATPAEVNTQVDTALSDIDLDHLIQVSAGAEEPTDGSYLDQVMHKAAGQTFDATTDSLEAIRDTLSSSTVTTVAAVSGDTITVVPYTTWEFTVDGLADLTDALADGIIFTVKEKYTDADSAAILQVRETAGLIVLNGSTDVTANKASLTVGAGEDEVTVHVNASQTGLAENRALVWDVKKVITEDEDADQMAVGTFHIADEAVTRAVGIA